MRAHKEENTVTGTCTENRHTLNNETVDSLAGKQGPLREDMQLSKQHLFYFYLGDSRMQYLVPGLRVNCRARCSELAHVLLGDSVGLAGLSAVWVVVPLAACRRGELVEACA